MNFVDKRDGVTIAEDTTAVARDSQLVVVYWNVAGIPKPAINQFLLDLEGEVMWDILILLEFSWALSEPHLSGLTSNGHLVKAQPYGKGRRAGAIIAHNRLKIRNMELCSQGRAFSCDFSWGGWNIRVIGGHADAGGDHRPYQRSMDDIEFLVDSTPRDHIVILGIDTQTPLGPQTAYDNHNLIGEFVMGNRGWKGDKVMTLLGSYDFHLPHTFVQGFDKLFTGTNNGKHEPKQMDYMATTAPKKWITKADRGVYDSTTSDHFPLVLTLIAKDTLKKEK